MTHVTDMAGPRPCGIFFATPSASWVAGKSTAVEWPKLPVTFMFGRYCVVNWTRQYNMSAAKIPVATKSTTDRTKPDTPITNHKPADLVRMFQRAIGDHGELV